MWDFRRDRGIGAIKLGDERRLGGEEDVAVEDLEPSDQPRRSET